MLRTIRTANADIRPIVRGITLEVAILGKNPLPIRGPARAEVKMIRMPRDADAIATLNVRCPDLVATRTGEMEGDPSLVGAQTQSVRQSLAAVGKFLRIGAVEVHAENLSDLVPYDL